MYEFLDLEESCNKNKITTTAKGAWVPEVSEVPDPGAWEWRPLKQDGVVIGHERTRLITSQIEN